MTSKPAPGPSARGRQPVSKPLAAVSSSTASTRGKQASGLSTKAAERITKPTVTVTRTDARQSIKPVKPTVSKVSERTNRSTSTRSTTEATPTPAPKESKNTPQDSTVPKTTECIGEITSPDNNNNLSESTTNTKPSTAPPSKPQNAGDKPTTPVPTSDSLQVAAQLYPWLYMTSTLDACFQSAEQTAKKDLETRARRLSESESEFADQKTRFQAESAAEFYDALSEDVFARDAPRITQAFLAHGDACERVETEALQIALNPVKVSSEGDEEDGDWDAPLRVYDEMLDTLEQLHAEALELEASIVKFTSSIEPHFDTEPGKGEEEPTGTVGDIINDKPIGSTSDADTESGAQTQILGVFKACLPVLRARIANLTMAQELVDGARENTSISLRMESLGLLD